MTKQSLSNRPARTVITTPSNIPKTLARRRHVSACRPQQAQMHTCSTVLVTIATASAAGRAAPAVALATNLLQLSTTEAPCLQHRNSTAANSTATTATLQLLHCLAARNSWLVGWSEFQLDTRSYWKRYLKELELRE